MSAPITKHSLRYDEVRQHLLARSEILLADVREEDPFAQGHPLWAANFPIARLELDAWRRIPQRDMLIVLYGHDGIRDLAPIAVEKLKSLGYTNVHILEGGLEAWKADGGELFIDVNVPSKSFGELVEAKRHTPLWDATKVKALLDEGANAVVFDARRFDEYQTMSIPKGINVPGGELVLRARDLAPDPETLVIVNCAGRTRSIIGTQSLINAGIPNKVVGLRNGTIGWTLAGQTLEQGASRSFADVEARDRSEAQKSAAAVAARAGVRSIALSDIGSLQTPDRTTYLIDVRTEPEYLEGHLPGFMHVPGGQLVQETDHYAPVRGARIVLSDDETTRANMAASWLAQMGWEVYVVEQAPSDAFSEQGSFKSISPEVEPTPTICVRDLSSAISNPNSDIVVLDFTTSANYLKGHIPGAWFALRSQLPEAIKRAPPAKTYVVTCGTSALAIYAAVDLKKLVDVPVLVLEGGNAAWKAAGQILETDESHLASPRIDRYRRPYEGTDAPVEAMQAYLDWEYGLVAQLDRDGTHFFNVI
ncbi:rhodanese-related sulfurtransferase [Agrobacterium rhizogenes]|uniref:Thiosulfate sulfurtransferase GlpE n=3 Tax=Agrobacterium TaxID=357 RepID=A0A5B9T1V7_AGRTU|nr:MULTISPECIES: rhodanese-related sulfurtransferase [Rhizobium/Agrobacterium group]KJF70751.1 sulfurtransferase [Agrobacterium arsenijevicii]NTF66102.1 rhodanese-related sulfurtransferase [Rhizobium rhizogenes]NTF97748.1 rhodanese-related sulfurtransferase [Rhizobium rhizogenes]NTG12112.1 rhodanese-related sulfurtransferase [Rhizobium rhizogenes]NTG97498.1 rhodanese-related sulfurtransferase [Rhizobium rhizogenes]